MGSFFVQLADPWIEQGGSAEFKVYCITSDQHHDVQQCGGRDQPSAFAARVVNVQVAATFCNLSVDRQSASGKGVQHMVVQPHSQRCALRRVISLDTQDTCFELKNHDGRDEQAGCQLDSRPMEHVHVGVAFSEFGHHVGVKQEHQDRSTGEI